MFLFKLGKQNKNKFYLDDCLTIMKGLKTNSIDLIVTDPPYRVIGGGINSKHKSGWKVSVLKANDTRIFKHNAIKVSDYITEFYRVLKPGTHCYIMTNNLTILELLTEAKAAGFLLHNVLVWRKNTCNANRWYMKNLEYTLFFYKKPAKRIHFPSSKQSFDFANPRHKVHPTQKPVELMQHYIENSSHINDIILDPFAGSGSTALACLKLKRRYICIEKDEAYYKVALQRIQKEI